METFHLTYVGPPRYAGALAQELENQDVLTSYRPPLETRDPATALTAVGVVFAATGPLPAVAGGVRALRPLPRHLRPRPARPGDASNR